MVASSGFSGLMGAAASAGTLFRRSQVATSISILGGLGRALDRPGSAKRLSAAAPTASTTRTVTTTFHITSPWNLLEPGLVALEAVAPLVSSGCSSANHEFRHWRRAPTDRGRRRAPCPRQAARDRRNTCAIVQARPREGLPLLGRGQADRCLRL